MISLKCKTQNYKTPPIKQHRGNLFNISLHNDVLIHQRHNPRKKQTVNWTSLILKSSGLQKIPPENEKTNHRLGENTCKNFIKIKDC